MSSARSINEDTAGAPGTGASIVIPGKLPHKRATVTPSNDEAPAGCAAQGFREQESAASANCANDNGDRKALATMKARAALCGYTLIEMAGGEYLLARWNYTRALPCLRAVGDLLRQIGGRHG